MKPSSCLLGLALCAAMVPVVCAQPGPPQRRLALEALDRNHDGQLSADEIAAATTSLLTLDRNHDGQLTADEYLPRQQDHTGESELQQRLMGMDRNGDGVLTADEMPERMLPLFKRADTNGDGKVTPAEIAALSAAQSGPQGRPAGRDRAEGAARFDLILNAIDIDHDGVLSAAELASAPGALKTLDKNADGILEPEEIRMRQQTPAERAAHVMEEHDTNGDGMLSKEEMPDRMQAQLGAMDTNHDGKVSLEELTAYFVTMPQNGRGGPGPRDGEAGSSNAPAADGTHVEPHQPASPSEPKL